MRKSIALVMSLLICTFCLAQERTIKGKVTSKETGEPLSAVSVQVAGSSTGTLTEPDGSYSITVNGRPLLHFSAVGMKTFELRVGDANTYNIELSPLETSMEEVVVVAQGLSREKKALGYAVSTISGEEVAQKPESDIGRLLAGKAPGVNIMSSTGISGSGTKINIRGFTSITGSTQPLFIVDGVPFNSSTNLLSNFSEGNQTTSSRFLDIDPNNIQDIQVLKGLSATVLYGEQGRNGVILITTKGGAGSKKSKPFEIGVVQSLYANQIASLPDYQYNYGNGSNNSYGAFYGNWGPSFNDLDSIPHPYSNRASFPEFQGKMFAFQPYKSVENFFRTGLISTTSINMGASRDGLSYSGTFSYLDELGFTPGNGLKKLNGGLGVTSNLSEKFVVSATFNYAQTDQKTPPVASGYGSGVTGGGSSLFADLFYTPINVDLMGFPWEDPITKGNAYYRAGGDMQNPRWTVHNVKHTNESRRFFGKTGLTYNVNKDFSILYRLGLDTYTETQEIMYNKGGAQKPNGMYSTTNITNTIWNHDVIANYQHKLVDNLRLTVTAGANAKTEDYRSNGLRSSNQLVYGLMAHSNFTAVEQINNWMSQKNTMGLYGQATFDYDQYLFLNLAGRNDWYSSLEKDYRSIFYPSASVSFVPTAAFSGLQSDILNYLKVRMGYGTSAKSPDPYSTRNVLTTNARAFIDNGGTVFSTNSISNTLGNPNLKAELQQEYEVGIEAKLINNRVGIDLTYFDRRTRDLITNMPLDPSTGYTSTMTNIGELSNKGIELGLTLVPIETKNFKWDAFINFYTYKSKVERLSTGLSEVIIAGFSGSHAGNFAIEGQPYGVIKATDFARNDKGKPIINSNGDHTYTSSFVIMGDPNPDFTSSLINTLTYKGLSFGMQWEYRQGGDIYSMTAQTMLARGVTKDTDFDRSRTFILDGVDVNGNPNTVQTDAAASHYRAFIWDGTTFRLREISLSYAIPKSWLSKTPFKAASFRLQGQNLWFNAIHFPKHVNFDTDQMGTGVGNGMGLDYLTGPSSKRFGGSLSITF